MLSNLPFLSCAVLTLLAAIAAMTLRNLVHCALCAAASFAGLAAIYLQLNAEFVGFAQILVYVGAVAILIVFTILLTHGSDVKAGEPVRSSSLWTGLGVAAVVLSALVAPITRSASLWLLPSANPQAPVAAIGRVLMTQYVLPLETIGLLLTAALLGGVVIAMREKPARKTPTKPSRAPSRELSHAA